MRTVNTFIAAGRHYIERVRRVLAFSFPVRTPTASRQPWEQLQRVVGKDGAAFFAGQLRACLDGMAALVTQLA